MSVLLREMVQYSRLEDQRKQATIATATTSKNKVQFTAHSLFKSYVEDIALARPSYISTISINAYYNEFDYSSSSRRDEKSLVETAHLRKYHPNKIDGDGSLDKIFKFYSKLQKPGVQKMKRALVFDEMREANTTLSYFELLVMFQNFEMIPNLVSKNEYLAIWKSCKARRGRRSHDYLETDNINELDFLGFLEVLVCAALVAFSKPGMCEDQDILSAPICVERLVKFLNLTDTRHTANIINTKGTETLAKLNNRSKGEVDVNRGKELMAERDVSRAASLILNAPSKIKIDNDNGVRNDKSTYIIDDTRAVWERARMQSSVPSTENNNNFNASQSFASFGNGTFGTAKSTHSVATSNSTYWGTGSSLFPSTSTAAKAQNAVNDALSLYSDDLLDMLWGFKYSEKGSTSWKEFSGPYCDFGTLRCGIKSKVYRGLLKITNNSKDPILISPCVDGVSEETLGLQFCVKPLPPGLTLYVKLYLQPGTLASDAEVACGVRLEISNLPRKQGNNERTTINSIRNSNPEEGLVDEVVVHVPIYFKLNSSNGAADCVGNYKMGVTLTENEVVKRAGFKIRKKSEKRKKEKDINAVVANQMKLGRGATAKSQSRMYLGSSHLTQSLYGFYGANK